MAYMPNARCLKLASDAANGKITEQDVLAAFERIAARHAELSAKGEMAGSSEKLRKFVAEEAERGRIKVAADRRIAAINILIKAKNLETIRQASAALSLSLSLSLYLCRCTLIELKQLHTVQS